MRKLILGSMTFALASLVSPLVNPASAIEYPYCAIGSIVCSEACDFQTLAQCRAFLGGGKGFCQPNPRYSSNAQAVLYTPRPAR